MVEISIRLVGFCKECGEAVLSNGEKKAGLKSVCRKRDIANAANPKQLYAGFKIYMLQTQAFLRLMVKIKVLKVV